MHSSCTSAPATFTAKNTPYWRSRETQSFCGTSPSAFPAYATEQPATNDSALGRQRVHPHRPPRPHEEQPRSTPHRHRRRREPQQLRPHPPQPRHPHPAPTLSPTTSPSTPASASAPARLPSTLLSHLCLRLRPVHSPEPRRCPSTAPPPGHPPVPPPVPAAISTSSTSRPPRPPPRRSLADLTVLLPRLPAQQRSPLSPVGDREPVHLPEATPGRSPPEPGPAAPRPPARRAPVGEDRGCLKAPRVDEGHHRQLPPRQQAAPRHTPSSIAHTQYASTATPAAELPSRNADGPRRCTR